MPPCLFILDATRKGLFIDLHVEYDVNHISQKFAAALFIFFSAATGTRHIRL
jgi:hypothetical protein